MIKYQFSGRSRIPVKNRKDGLFYYELRDCDPGETGYSIERFVAVNNIGCLVTDYDILGDRPWITDEEFEAMDIQEATDLI